MFPAFRLTADADVFQLKSRCFPENPYFPFDIIPLYFNTNIGSLDENPRYELTIFLDIFLTK